MTSSQRQRNALALLAFAMLALVANTEAAKASCGATRPTWPTSYKVEYTYQAPDTNTFRPSTLSIPVRVWMDGVNARTRVELYGGRVATMANWKTREFYTLVPVLNERQCTYITDFTLEDYSEYAGNSATGSLSWSLPVIDQTWMYAGTGKVRNTRAYIWQSSIYGANGTQRYPYIQRLYIAISNNRPLRLVNTIFTDEFVFDITSWVPGPIDDSVFQIPRSCLTTNQSSGSSSSPSTSSIASQSFKTVCPNGCLDASPARAYSIWGGLVPPAKGMAGASETASLVAQNQRLVVEHNNLVRAGSSAASYILKLNKFAYMTPKEIQLHHKGLNQRPRVTIPRTNLQQTFQRVIADKDLPTYVDWRGTGADGPGVKDQLRCGGCWSFSAVGGMQAQWFLKTNQSLSFSEQQLLDCTWNNPDLTSCYGGYPADAIAYVAENGGIATEDDHPYTGTFGYCAGTSPFNASSPSPAGVPLTGKFNGYMNVTAYDEKALMEAVVRYGPIAVIINAGPISFYAGGIFNDPICRNQTVDDCDHAVVVMGYGTDNSTGVPQDYWIIKNSYGISWGDNGYAFISRAGTACGITSWPVVAVVDEEAAAQAVAAQNGACQA